MSMQQFFVESYNGDTLAEFVKFCAAVAPTREKLTRKDQRAQYLTDTLLNPRHLKQLWEALDDLSRKAVASAYHNGGEFVADAFVAQYGALPERPQKSAWYYQQTPIRLDLFILGRTIPPELMPLLADLVPPPDRFQIDGVETLDAIINKDATLKGIRVAETEKSGWHDLLLFLQLFDQGAIKLNSTGTKLTPASLVTLQEKLLDSDFFQPSDLESGRRWSLVGAPDAEPVANKVKAEDAIRPFGLVNFALGAGLISTSQRGGLTETGRALLMRQEPELLLDAFEVWQQSNLFDELTRINAINGLRSRDLQLSKPSLRRERIVEALSWCPVNVWINTSEFYRALKIWHFDFEIEEGGIEKLYVGYRYGGSRYYEAWGTDQDMWLLTNGLYISAVLWEYLATIGALDIAYLPPYAVGLDVSPYLDFDEEYFSRYDGLLYFRINPLGAYLFGQAGDYSGVTTTDAPLLHISADRLLQLVDPARVTPVVKAQLEQIAVQEGENSYRLDSHKILLALEEGAEIEAWRDFLTRHSAKELPTEVNHWLEDLDDASRAFSVAGPMLRIHAASEELVQLVLADAELGKVCKALGNRDLVIPTSRESRFRNRLRELGYGLR